MKRDRIIGVGAVGRLVARVLLAVMLVALPVGAALADNDALLFPGQQVMYGKNIAEWTAEWWQFVAATPADFNIVLDPSGTSCANVQSGPVWFLAGTTIGGTVTTRSCTIPADRALLFPLLNLADVNTASQPVKELRAEIADCMNHASNLSVTLDGVAVSDKVLDRSRVKSVPFSIVFPPGGFPTIPPVSAAIYSPGVDDGYYVMLKPLPVGQHTLRITGSSPGCSYVPTGFTAPAIDVDVTYNLTIAPVSLK
jgi:hypothetical protein